MQGSDLVRLLIAGVVGLLVATLTQAGQQTRLYVLVSMGAALIAVLSAGFFRMLDLPWYSDPGRLSAQVVSALGFIGSGLIWFTEDKQVKGIASAALLWLTAILGLLIGAGLQNISVAAVFFVVLLLVLDRSLDWEKHIDKKNRENR